MKSQKRVEVLEGRLKGSIFHSYRALAKVLKKGEKVKVYAQHDELGCVAGWGEVENSKDGKRFTYPSVMGLFGSRI